MQTIARNSESLLSTAYNQTNGFRKGHSSAYGRVETEHVRGAGGTECADGHIARTGHVQTFGSELALPHFGYQLVTNLGEFFYLFILQVKRKKKKRSPHLLVV